jgi:hypothetical protein
MVGGIPSRPARRMSLVAACACLVVLVMASLASAKALPPPGGFRLHASNGYSLEVFSIHKSEAERGEVLVLVEARRSAVLYFTHATVSETSIEADLGSVGRIDVNFVPSGRAKKERSQCGGRSVAVDSGRYVGSIDFKGEQGYSEVHATSARGDAKFALSLTCAESRDEGFGGHSPGALLSVHHRGGTSFEFEARKNGPSRPARFNASIHERQGPLLIDRGVAVESTPATFDFNVPAGTATVTPPAPFDGEATFSRTSKGATWHGDLTVDFPGRAGVHLTGAGTHSSLVRAVQNPVHPFRLP